MSRETLSRVQYERSQRLVRSDRFTRMIHEGYPASQRDPEVVVVWDPLFHGGRWALARQAQGFIEEGGTFHTVDFLKLFYYWEGPGDSFLHPTEHVQDGVHTHVGMVQWLRDHDLCSSNHCGEWDDRMFGAQAAAEEDWEESFFDDVHHQNQIIFDQHGRKLELPSEKAGIDNSNRKYWGADL